MNTQPRDPQRLRALELSIQARREELPADDQRFLSEYLSAHPEVAEEAREMDLVVSELNPGPLPARPEFTAQLQATVAGWIRDDALARPRSAGPEGWLAARWRGLLSVRGTPGVSPSTLVLGRSLAFYLGAACVLCAFLLLREPTQGPEVRTNDRAHTLTDDRTQPKERPSKPDLRGPRPK